MITRNSAIITVDDAREALIQFWANVLADKNAVLEQLRDGALNIPVELVAPAPDAGIKDPAFVVDQYGELCLGEELIKQNPGVDDVLIRTGDYSFELVATKEQLPPKEKKNPC